MKVGKNILLVSLLLTTANSAINNQALAAACNNFTPQLYIGTTFSVGGFLFAQNICVDTPNGHMMFPNGNASSILTTLGIQDNAQISGTSVIYSNGIYADSNANTAIKFLGTNADNFIIADNVNMTFGSGGDTIIFDAAEGADLFKATNTQITGDILLGSGNDAVEIWGATIFNGNIDTGEDDDTAIINDNSTIAAVNMRDGSDSLTINGSDITLNAALDGGDDIDTADGWVDTLTFNHWVGLAPEMNNWEMIQLNSAAMDLGTSSTIIAGNFNIDTSSTLTAKNGSHSISGNVDNLGIIDMSDNNISKGLTVGGDYTGTGTVMMDVDLASEQSDILTVGGDVNAQGHIDFNRVGGDHAGKSASILVIDAPNDNQSTISNFQFDGTVGGSAYIWTMANIAGQGFYIGYKQEVGSPRPPTIPKTPSVLPSIPAYASLPSIGRAYADNTTLHERLGELRRFDGWIGSGSQNIRTSMGRAWSNQLSYIPDSWNMWAKGVIGGLDIDGNKTYQLDGTYGGFDIGADRKFTTNKEDFLIYAGLFGGYRTGDFNTSGHSDHFYDSPIGADIEVDAWSLGAYATLFWNDTSYLDLVAKYMELNGNISYDQFMNNNETLSPYGVNTDGEAVSFSAEYGHRIDLAQSWILEPQVQLSYLYMRWDDIIRKGSTSYTAIFEDTHYVTTRAGLRLEKTFTLKNDAEFKPWMRINILHELGDAPIIETGDVQVRAHDLSTYGQFDIGATYVLRDNIQLYGNGSYRANFNDYNSYEVGGGLRISW